MCKTIVPALAVLSLAVLAAPSAAQTETVSVEVPYRDLDLSTASGVETLRTRIARAVARVCGPMEMRPFFKVETQRRCVRQANASADAQVARIIDSETELALLVTANERR